MAECPAIGIVGAGMIGSGMARSLLRVGHAVPVTAHRDRRTVDALLAEGALEAGNLATLDPTSKARSGRRGGVFAAAKKIYVRTFHRGEKIWIRW
jgi:3-hydroxyacyl-CoA dehydrogenase